jgi:transposase-like protein
MPKPVVDKPKAARALAEWAFKNYKYAEVFAIADKFEVNEKTVRRWRNALEHDVDLSRLFEERFNELLNQDWGKKLEEAISTGISKVQELLESSESLPEAVEALKALAEIKITREVLAPNAANGKQNTEPREAVATPQTYTVN